MSAVPVIDVSGLAGDAAAKQDAAARIGVACQSIGFLCVTGHGLPADLIARVHAASLAFFDLPEAKKRRIAVRPPSYRGYVPLATEGLSCSLGRRDAAVDLMEALRGGCARRRLSRKPGCASAFRPECLARRTRRFPSRLRDVLPHVPDSFVVNSGDLMAQWTNDRFVSTLHRVADPPRGAGTRLLSIAFFHQSNFDAVIGCIPGCSDAGRSARHARSRRASTG